MSVSVIVYSLFPPSDQQIEEDKIAKLLGAFKFFG